MLRHVMLGRIRIISHGQLITFTRSVFLSLSKREGGKSELTHRILLCLIPHFWRKSVYCGGQGDRFVICSVGPLFVPNVLWGTRCSFLSGSGNKTDYSSVLVFASSILATLWQRKRGTGQVARGNVAREWTGRILDRVVVNDKSRNVMQESKLSSPIGPMRNYITRVFQRQSVD